MFSLCIYRFFSGDVVFHSAVIFLLAQELRRVILDEVMDRKSWIVQPVWFNIQGSFALWAFRICGNHHDADLTCSLSPPPIFWAVEWRRRKELG